MVKHVDTLQLHPCVVIVNVMFGLLAMFHLAYLGLMFDSSDEQDKVMFILTFSYEAWKEYISAP